MTTPVAAQRNTVSAVGFTNPLNLPANAEAASHVKVYGNAVELTLGVDYTLEGVGDTGNLDEIAGVNALIEQDTIDLDIYDTFTIVHEPPLDQDESLSSGGTLGRIYEAALDAIVRRMQSLGGKVDRALRLSVDSSGVDVELPLPSPGLALKWNPTGTALINSLADPDSDELSAAAQFLADAEAAAEAAEDAEAGAVVAAGIATTQAGNAATSAAAAAQSAIDAAAAAGDIEAVLAALEAATVPPGTSIFYNSASLPPEGRYLKENGAAVSRTTYADLFTAIGTTYGAGDGATTFNLPESRGEFFRGLDDGRGVDVGRTIASAQSEMVGPHGHTATSASAGSHGHVMVMRARRGGNGNSYPRGWDGGDVDLLSNDGYSTTTDGAHAHTITVNTSTGTENRPRNKAKLVCIRY
jgi:microcystin-dependent protein